MTPSISEDDDQAYFQAIEEIFVGLRGAPLLLSPGDWHVARRWHQWGIPLDLVRHSLEEVFARRLERGAKGRISSLRYVASAVEEAWEERRELTAPGERSAAPAFDLPARLRALAAAIPRDLPGRESLAAEIVRLAAGSMTAGQIEEQLTRLDHQALDGAGSAAEVDIEVEKTLAALAGRLSPEEIENSRLRLRRQVLRRRFGLPLLSLFSPEAEAADALEEKTERK